VKGSASWSTAAPAMWMGYRRRRRRALGRAASSDVGTGGAVPHRRAAADGGSADGGGRAAADCWSADGVHGRRLMGLRRRGDSGIAFVRGVLGFFLLSTTWLSVQGVF
jgi:hypothetical protein